MNKSSIRPIDRSEIPHCVRLIRESFRTVADEFGFTQKNAPRFTAFSTTEERLYWHADKEHRPMYGYFQDGDVVGYYSLLPDPSGKCELNQLCVHPSCRHRGIGKDLLLHAINTAVELGCTCLHIGIVEENRTLRLWYERFGFIHTGVKKFDFFPFTCGYMEKQL